MKDETDEIINTKRFKLSIKITILNANGIKSPTEEMSKPYRKIKTQENAFPENYTLT